MKRTGTINKLVVMNDAKLVELKIDRFHKTYRWKYRVFQIRFILRNEA